MMYLTDLIDILEEVKDELEADSVSIQVGDDDVTLAAFIGSMAFRYKYSKHVLDSSTIDIESDFTKRAGKAFDSFGESECA